MTAEFVSSDVESRFRPFYFTVVVWGENFRNFFLDYCIASLLAPNNIPIVRSERPIKFVIATTAPDRREIESKAIFRALQREAETIFLEIPPCPSDRPAWKHSVVGHRLCADYVWREKGYLVVIWPDCIFSNGTIRRLHELALAGAEAVINNVQPRIAEEPFFETLRKLQMLPSVRARDSGLPSIFDSRTLVSIALQSMHSMTIVNEWEKPYFCDYAATPWWRVPGFDGIVAFGMVWSMFLTDFSAVKHHDSSLLERAGFDGDYFMETLRGLKRIYVIRDSDEIYVASWSLLSYQKCTLGLQRFGELSKGACFRLSYYGPPFNPLHRRLLLIPTRFHSGPTTDVEWEKTEQKALGTLLTWLDEPEFSVEFERDFPLAYFDQALANKISVPTLPWWRRNFLAWAICRWIVLPEIARLSRTSSQFGRLRKAWGISKRVFLILRRDSSARDWIKKHIRVWSRKIRALGK